ncbi:hypothetical protein T12_15925 [Trichinella patagoniensis]|uniref:Uncharacterized protein n=1 Tax=Trichinella patagoniensis TaxID=990121 RepID=A0A0V0ZQM5_9BILA|nr:hypothetical protein T12_15925 [Trichinella patagoniensis]
MYKSHRPRKYRERPQRCRQSSQMSFNTQSTESAPSSPRFKMLDLTEILSDGVLVKDCFTGVLVRRMKVKNIYGKFLANHRYLNSESRKIDCETANAIQKRSLSQLCLIYGYWSAQTMITHRRNPWFVLLILYIFINYLI